VDLTIHPHAADDIRSLLKQDVNGVGKLLALLSEIQSDPDLIDRLNQQGDVVEFESGEKINALRVQSVKRIADIWRLKAWESNSHSIPYRLLYGYFQAGQFRKIPLVEILAAVARKTYNYEPDHPITLRVIADYNALL
jgi:hypothetical protein